jgi:hypothetical protein
MFHSDPIGGFTIDYSRIVVAKRRKHDAHLSHRAGRPDNSKDSHGDDRDAIRRGRPVLERACAPLDTF